MQSHWRSCSGGIEDLRSIKLSCHQIGAPVAIGCAALRRSNRDKLAPGTLLLLFFWVMLFLGLPVLAVTPNRGVASNNSCANSAASSGWSDSQSQVCLIICNIYTALILLPMKQLSETAEQAITLLCTYCDWSLGLVSLRTTAKQCDRNIGACKLTVKISQVFYWNSWMKWYILQESSLS